VARPASVLRWRFGRGWAGRNILSTLYLPREEAPMAIDVSEEKLLEAVEVERREAAGIEDLAATARYHASRLPADSRWRASFLRVASALSPDVQQPDQAHSDLAPR
jgi:hypothetical protein